MLRKIKRRMAHNELRKQGSKRINKGLTANRNVKKNQDSPFRLQWVAAFNAAVKRYSKLSIKQHEINERKARQKEARYAYKNS